MEREILAAPMIIATLQFLALSAIATDRFQTEHWVAGTPSRPTVTPSGAIWWELNPLLAGKPEMLDEYMRALEAVTLEMPHMLGPPWNVLALACWTAGAVQTVLSNNEDSVITGYPQYYVLAYRWTW